MEELFEEDRQLIARLRATEADMVTADEEQMRVLSARAESLNKRIAARDSYHYDVRIRTVLGGMGFERLYDQKVSTMSGGERTKLKLCRLLLEEPELLVLDEPTKPPGHLHPLLAGGLSQLLQGRATRRLARPLFSRSAHHAHPRARKRAR